jgi:molybdenum cofactor cytidylyltransferase
VLIGEGKPMAVEGVILAAGLSSRAKAYKMTLKLNGKTIIEHAIDNMAGFVKRIIVVGGYRIENLEPIIKRYDNAVLVFNENFNLGMFSSIKKGVSCVTEEKFFLTPGDYPLINPSVYQAMLSADDELIIPTYEGKRGHPVLIKSCFKSMILEDGRYESLRDFVNERSIKYMPVDCRGILMDVDTMEDYKGIIGFSEKGGV